MDTVPGRSTRICSPSCSSILEGDYSLSYFLLQFPTVSREQAIQALEEAKDSLLARIA
jgi:hypothetical protein